MTGQDKVQEIVKEVRSLARMANKARKGLVSPRLALSYIKSQAALISEYASELKEMAETAPENGAENDALPLPRLRRQRAPRAEHVSGQTAE